MSDQSAISNKDKFTEIGTPGINIFSGIIEEAYRAELYWPGVAEEYNELWRGDPEIGIIRQIFSVMTRQLSVEWRQNPKNDVPSPQDQLLVDFLNESNEDIEGGIEQWLEDCILRVPFFGWGWWYATPGLRKKGWRPPDEDDNWKSKFDDGLIGIRRLGFRSYTTFDKWEMTERTNRLKGMWQFDIPNPPVYMPLENSIHITFGDNTNPEGLATLEAIWRLAKIKKGLELIQGIGFEHAAGYLSFESDEELSPEDKSYIRKVALAVMTAQENNYIALPNGLRAEVKDVGFGAAGSILEAIRYYGILKMTILGAQWAALSTISGVGSYAALAEGNDFFLSMFNNMIAGIAKQFEEQYLTQILKYNPVLGAVDILPVLYVNPVLKTIELNQLGGFISTFGSMFQLSEDDLITIRRQTRFLPETLPEPENVIYDPDKQKQEIPFESKEEIEIPEEEELPEAEETEEEEANMAFRPFVVSDKEQPLQIQMESYDPKTIRKAMREFDKWAERNNPDFVGILNAVVDDGGLLSLRLFAKKLPTTGFIWDPRVRNYRDASTGRLISRSSLIKLGSEYREAMVGISLLNATSAFFSGTIDLASWQMRFASIVTLGAITEMLLMRGGYNAATPSDYYRLNNWLDKQATFAQRLGDEIKLGTLTRALIVARVTMYAKSIRHAEFIGKEEAAKDGGLTTMQRFLNPGESCKDCIEYAAMGPQPIGALPLPGEASECMSNCNCDVEYS